MNSPVTLTQNKVLMERYIKTLPYDIVQFSTDSSLFILLLSAGPIINKFTVWKAEEPEKSHMVQKIARVVSRLCDWLITLKKIGEGISWKNYDVGCKVSHTWQVLLSRPWYFHAFVSSLNHGSSSGANNGKKRWSCDGGRDGELSTCSTTNKKRNNLR